MSNHTKGNNLLMAVFGQVNTDGRVLRSIRSLQDDFDLSIYGSVSDDSFTLPNVNLVLSTYKLPYYSRLLVHLIFHIQFLRLALKTRPAVIYVHDYYLSALGFVAGRLCGSKIIYDAHELIIDSKFRESKRNWFYAQLEKVTIDKYDLVISANDERALQLIKFYGLKSERVVSVKNIPGESVHQGIKGYKELSQSYPFISEGKKYIIYQGVVTPIRDLDKILAPLSRYKEFDILIVGEGPKKYFDTLVLKYADHTNIHFVGKVDLNTLYSFVKISFCGIISYSMQNLNNKYCAPNKLYEYAQFDLKMLTTSQILFQKTFEEFPFGMILSSSTSKSELDLFLSKKISHNMFEEFRKKNSNVIEQKKLLSNVQSLLNRKEMKI
jgi:hypothetical protein